jgi:hypothetical protein
MAQTGIVISCRVTATSVLQIILSLYDVLITLL